MKGFWHDNWKWVITAVCGIITIYATMKVDSYRIDQVETKARENAAAVQETRRDIQVIRETVTGMKKDVEYILIGINDLKRQEQRNRADGGRP